MRLFQVILAISAGSVLVLGWNLAAGSGPTAILSPDKNDYHILSRDALNGVHFTFTNTGSQDISLSSTGPWSITIPEGPVYVNHGADAIIDVPPGESWAGVWHFTTDCYYGYADHPCILTAAPPGTYTINWTYSDQNRVESFVEAQFTVRL